MVALYEIFPFCHEIIRSALSVLIELKWANSSFQRMKSVSLLETLIRLYRPEADYHLIRYSTRFSQSNPVTSE